MILYLYEIKDLRRSECILASLNNPIELEGKISYFKNMFSFRNTLKKILGLILMDMKKLLKIIKSKRTRFIKSLGVN